MMLSWSDGTEEAMESRCDRKDQPCGRFCRRLVHLCARSKFEMIKEIWCTFSVGRDA